jgi:hypothetical protein
VQRVVNAAFAITGGDYVEARDWSAALEVAADARGRTPLGSYAWTQLATAELMIRAARGEDAPELVAEIASTPVEDSQQWWIDMAGAVRPAAAPIGTDASMAVDAEVATEPG